MSSLSQQFLGQFGRPPQVIAEAPGRVEFIGNHTDYNGGSVIGVAIDRYVRVAAAVNRDGYFRVRSTNGSADVFLLSAPDAMLRGMSAWANYVLGVWRSLGDFDLPRPSGFDLLVESDLPPGAGLSSSAALELSTALALLQLAGAPAILPDKLAALGRHAENKYAGMPCGILDQATSAFGVEGQAVVIRCCGPHFFRVPLPMSVRLWVFNTRQKHNLVDGLYATRHAECAVAKKALGVMYLADLTPGNFDALGTGLPDVVARRARHVIEENARVQATVSALEQGDMETLGKLLTASHRSSQHLFQNSTPALDQLVDLLEKHPAVYGARLTGGGFGGAVMALTKLEFTEEAAAVIADQNETRPEILELHSSHGARLVRKPN